MHITNQQISVAMSLQNHVSEQQRRPVIEPNEPRRNSDRERAAEDALLNNLLQEVVILANQDRERYRGRLPPINTETYDQATEPNKLQSREIERYLPTNLYREFEKKFNDRFDCSETILAH